MFLFVGLGNPEPQYTHNRHNIGFMAIDALAAHYECTPFREKFKGGVSEGKIAGEKILLLKPNTYMNESGISVGAAAQFYKLTAAQIVVFHDEIDLPPAKIRLQAGGGAAGHNGIKSVVAHIGKDFRRVRLGVGHPGAREKVSGHVLSNFAREDQAWLAPLLDALVRHAPLLVAGQDALYQTRLHEAMQNIAPQQGGA